MKKLLIAAALLSFWMVPHMAQAACSNPAGDEGTQIYNADHKTMQFCDGTDWIAMGALSPAAGGGITVQFTTSTYNGNLGGLSGANAKCKSEFTGSYFCPEDDYLRSGDSSGITAWVHGLTIMTGWSDDWARDCGSWTENSTENAGLTTTGNDECNTARKLACCSQ